MSHNFDVLCVGNAKIDTFLTLHKIKDHLRYLEATNELCIKFGEKINVDKAEILLGGNASNVAVGLSRLGLKVGIIAEIGKDEFAQKIINTLNAENVDTSSIFQTEGQESSFSTIINFKGERTIFSEHVKRAHNFNFDNLFSKWVYLTSLGEEWENAYQKTVDFVKNTNAHLTFNPGTLQIAAGKERLINVLSLTNILIVNKEEGQSLLKTGNQNAKEILIGLQKLGPKIVVITDGKNGSYVIDENGNIVEEKIVETEVIEKTGAGDAYSSGFLGAVLYNKSIKDAMRWGARNSASVITKVGAQTGLLGRKGLE